MNNLVLAKVKALVFTLTISGASFGQLNNCINTKEHPLILEVIDSIRVNPNYNSILAYTIIKGDQIGLSRDKVLNLAYAWASCKKITNMTSKKEEEFKYLFAILDEREFEKLVSYVEKYINKR